MNEIKHSRGPISTREMACIGRSAQAVHDAEGNQIISLGCTKNAEANAARVVLTWNCHDELLAAAELAARVIRLRADRSIADRLALAKLDLAIAKAERLSSPTPTEDQTP